jgi:hypothetical protein
VVGEFVATLAAEELAARMELIHQVETSGVSVVRQSLPAPAPEVAQAPAIATPAAKPAAPSALARVPKPVWAFAAALTVLSLIGIVSVMSGGDAAPQPSTSSAAVVKPEPPPPAQPAPEVPAEAAPEPSTTAEVTAAEPSSAPPAAELPASAHGPERRYRAPVRPKEFLPNEL